MGFGLIEHFFKFPVEHRFLAILPLVIRLLDPTVEDSGGVAMIVVVLVDIDDFVLVLALLIFPLHKLIVIIVVLVVFEPDIGCSHRLLNNLVNVFCVIVVLGGRVVVVQVRLHDAQVLGGRAVWTLPIVTVSGVSVVAFCLHHRSFIYLSNAFPFYEPIIYAFKAEAQQKIELNQMSSPKILPVLLLVLVGMAAAATIETDINVTPVDERVMV